MFNKKEVAKMLFTFAELGIQKQKIVKFLFMQKNGVFVGNYTDLTKALGLKTGSSGSQPNIRKALLELEKMQIVDVMKNNKQWQAIILKKSWLLALNK